ncbi:hypothetical protein BH09DEP1_BH09DEP1_6210 [soil metagenome]
MVFGFLKNTLQKIYSTVTSPIKALFARPIDEQALTDLEVILLSADTGIRTTKMIMEKVKSAWQHGTLKDGQDLKALLQQELLQLLESQQFGTPAPIILLVGINGSGKTTAAAKIAHSLIEQNKKVLFVAADTFRAAATQQLERWASQLHSDIVIGAENQDPASVVFAGMQKFKAGGYDAVIIDTAGRLQTKTNLMKELEKIKRVIAMQAPDQKITTLLTIDSMLGQNSFEQAKLFNESAPINGVILTKMDGTGKGGIVFAINNELQIPIAYISYGEKPEQIKKFEASEYVQELLN